MTDKPEQSRDCLSDGGRLFRKKLTGWYVAHARDYPWRRTQDPYAILVSELMLQQTRIATVLERGYYERWMQRFPDTKTLAQAGEEEVLKHWEGLGYYSRARNLQAAAQLIEQDFQGHFPTKLEDIESLPGVGPYTAGAVASFAYDIPAAVVDGNVIRVLTRILDLRESVDSSSGNQAIWSYARDLMPRRKKAGSREYNSALMELGQRICLRTNPLCHTCPVAAFCSTRDPESLPVKKPRKKPVLTEEHVLFCMQKKSILLEKEEGTRRKGLWRLPRLEGNHSHAEKPPSSELLLTMNYSITKYRVTLNVYRGQRKNAPEKGQWITLDQLDQISLGAPYRKALGKLL